MTMNNITIIPIKNLPEFSPKHDLADELIKGFKNNNIALAVSYTHLRAHET